jgi:predicted RNase H-like HicB family nuclease
MKKGKIFSVEIIKELDGKNFYAIVPALPGCFSQGKTIEEAKKNIAAAIELHLGCLKKDGETPPDFETYQTTIQVGI